jgi:hypothetical protein
MAALVTAVERHLWELRGTGETLSRRPEE